MTNDKWKIIWQIMKDIRLKFDQRSDNEICCVICNRTLINAHSSPCGCRYCLECIQEYLNEGDQICPGNTDNCTDELLNMDRDIHIDQPMNRKIFKTIVKCPEDNCEFKDELRNIEDHLKISHNQLVNCPYFNIGCNLSGIKSKDVKNHLLAEIVSHNQMMFQVIENLQKDNKDLKESIIHLELKYENENREIKEKLKAMEVDKMAAEQKCIQESQDKYEKQNQEIIKNVKDLKEGLINREMKENLNEMKVNKISVIQKCIQESQDKYEKQNQEIIKNVKELKEGLTNLQSKYENENREMKEKLKEMENTKLVEVQKCINNSQTKYEKQNQEITKNIKDLKENVINLQMNHVNENKEIKEKLQGMEKNKLVELQKCIQESQTKYERQNQEIVKSVKEIENQIVTEKKENETKFDEISRWKIYLPWNDEWELSDLKDKINKLEKNQESLNYGEFVWIIDKWRMRSKEARDGINEVIYSDAFYTHKNGYKMRLCVYPDGNGSGEGTHLSVYFHIMRGEFDNSLSWPFTHDVTIELINQHTGQVHTSQTVQSYEYLNCPDVYKRPTTDRNQGYGYQQFMSLFDLRNNQSLTNKNKISIRCLVDTE